MENYSNIIASKLYIPKINIPFMENQLNDQPPKWIERSRYGLCDNKSLSEIFGETEDRGATVKTLDYHSTLNPIKKNDSPNLKRNETGNNENTDHFFSFLREKFDELKDINKELDEFLGKQKDALEWYPTIKGVLECNKALTKIIRFCRKWIRNFKNWNRRNNIKKYKENKTWIPEEEWNKLSLFEKLMKRWNFSDKHQCLVPWEEKKLSKEELLQFQEMKRQWRIKRKSELNGNTHRQKIFEKFCHARIINNRMMWNLDISYDDKCVAGNKMPRKNIIHIN